MCSRDTCWILTREEASDSKNTDEMTNLSENVAVTVKAVVSIFSALGLGLGLVKWNVLTQDGVKALSSLIQYFFLPLTFFISLGTGLTPSLLTEAWIIPVSGLGVLLINGGVAYLLAKVFETPDWFFPWQVTAMSFSNVLALPLMFVYSVCEHGDIPESAMLAVNKTSLKAKLSTEQCIHDGNIIVFLAIILSTFALWSIVLDYFVRTEEYRCLSPNTPISSNEVAGTREVQATPQMEMTRLSTQDELLVTDVAHRLTSVSETEFSADLEREARTSLGKKLVFCIHSFFVSLARPATSSQVAGIFVALVPALQRALFHPNSVLAPVTSAMKVMSAGFVPALNLVLSGSLGIKMCSMTMKAPLRDLGLPRITLLVLVLGRMLILPAVSFAVIYALQEFVFPKDRLLLLIFYFSFATPTNNGVVVMAQLVGNQRAAEALAVGMLLQHVAGIFTMSTVMFLAFNVTQNLT